MLLPIHLVGMDNEILESWKGSYSANKLYSKVLNTFQINDDKDGSYPNTKLIYFKDWNAKFVTLYPQFPSC